MAYITAEARQHLLDAVAQAIDQLGVAVAALGDAHELLDDVTADRLESELFRPLQTAYGRGQRTHAEFAARHGLPTRTFEPGSPGASSRGVDGFLDGAVRAVGEADGALARLQDSMLPVEVGDAELRAGLAEMRRMIGDLPGRARRFARLRGR